MLVKRKTKFNRIATSVGAVFIFLIVTFYISDAKHFELVKSAFRILRSELHFAQFLLLTSTDEISNPMTALVILPGKQMVFIAHATGQVLGKSAPNSIEGLNASVERGCRYIEADFEWTSDGQLVSSHDWKSFFGDRLPVIPDFNAFRNRRRADGFTQMTFEDINRWLLSHPEARLVTDVKIDNPKALQIFRHARSFLQIIPQVYSFYEFAQAKKMGFDQIILTTYKTYYSTSSLRRFSEKAHPSAVTVPLHRLSAELLAEMSANGTPVFTHPVPSHSDLEKLPRGVSGIYSTSMCS